MPFLRQRFTARFISLVVVGYLIGLVTVAWTVWLVSQPILAEMNRNAIEDRVQTEASALNAIVDDHLDEIRYYAREDTVLQYALGYPEYRLAAQDHLAELANDATVQAAAIYEFTGTRVLATFEENATLNEASTIAGTSDMVHAILSQDSASIAPLVAVLQQEDHSDVRFAAAHPIISRGLVEGVLLVEFSADLHEILPALNRIEGPEMQGLDATGAVEDENGVVGDEFIRLRVAGTELSVIAPAFSDQTEETGMRLVRSVLQALVVVLALPFIAILLLGYRVIVGPQRKLAASEGQLTKQRNELLELTAVLEVSNDAIITTDSNRRILWVNPGFERVTGFSEADAIGRRTSDFLQIPGANDQANAEIDLAIAIGAPVKSELHCARADGTLIWLSTSVAPVRSARGEVTHFAAILSDITRNKVYEEELERSQVESRHRSLHDALTGLPNRRYFDEHVTPLDQQSDEDRCLIRIDLDHFKAVNDSFGHAAGDHVLMVVAEILRAHCGAGDFAARVGGDEFLILLSPDKSQETADAICKDLLTQISKEIEFEGSICRVGASFGIAHSAVVRVGLKDLLVSADAALYKSKEDGRNRITLYTPELHEAVLENRRISKELETAIEEESFEPWYQPQFDAISGALVGVEALARWIHPTRGAVPPGLFLPMVEKMSLTDALDNIIYRKGLRQVELFHAAGIKIPKISFNVSTKQIENPDLGSIADAFDLHGTIISLEILESVVIEEMSDDKLGNLFSLRERGFNLELDDFGSGHASIAGLLKLRPDIIKIDQVLVRPVVNSPIAQELISSIVDIGRALGVVVTAEGVETHEHVEILRGCGISYLQGFHFSRPVAADVLARLIQGDGFPKIADDDWGVAHEPVANTSRSA